MADQDPIDEPAPTIVGPQPPQSGRRRPMNVPRGLEHVLALACLNDECRANVLADPLKAAEDAGLKLGESERAVLRSIPRSALEPMIDSFARAAGTAKPDLAKSATLAAASAVLAASLSGCDKVLDFLGAKSAGLTEDVPPAKEEQTQQSSSGDYSMAPGGVRADEPLGPSEDRIMVGPSSGAPKEKSDIQLYPAPGSPIEKEEAKPEIAPQAQSPAPEPPEDQVTRGIRADIP